VSSYTVTGPVASYSLGYSGSTPIGSTHGGVGWTSIRHTWTLNGRAEDGPYDPTVINVSIKFSGLGTSCTSNSTIAVDCDTCYATASITGCPTDAVTAGSSTTMSSDLPGAYTWSLAGGGSLTNVTDTSVTYVAPSTNPNCANNGTVSLKCEGSTIDDCTIAMNGYASPAETAYYVFRDNNCETVEFPPLNLTNCDIYRDAYNCDGDLIATVHYIQQTSPGDDCSGCFAALSVTYGNLFDSYGGTYITALAGSPWDVRTAGMLAGGCCPDALK